MQIQHQTIGDTKGEFTAWIRDRQAGMMTYSKLGSRQLIIDHTEVEEGYKGKGVGRKLVFEAVNHARKAGKTIIPLCPFAKSIFEKHPEIQDALRKKDKST